MMELIRERALTFSVLCASLKGKFADSQSLVCCFKGKVRRFPESDVLLLRESSQIPIVGTLSIVLLL